MSAHAEHHGPPIANQSSRVSSTVLGMFLFIASEAMLFGSFFTVYFFIRVVNPDAQPWPLPPYHLPVFVAGVNTAVLLTSSFTMHWALQSIKRGNRNGLKAGLVLTLLMGLAFLLTQMLEYARIGFNPERRGLRLGLLRPHRPSRGPRLRRADAPDRCGRARLPRSLHAGAPSRRRASGNLLALRRRNVDRGVRVDLPPLRRPEWHETRFAARPRRIASCC